MNLSTLQTFLMWCTIINGGLLIFWTAWCFLAPDLVYRTQRAFFPVTKEVYTIVMYSFLGGFKLLFLMFNLVPFIALLIMRGA